MNENRLKKILARLADFGLSQMVITDPSAICYLIGVRIDPGERLLALYLNSDGNHKLIVNRLFDIPEGTGVSVELYDDNADGAGLLARFTRRDKPLGVDKNMASRFLLRLMELHAASSFVCSSQCVDLPRAGKDAGEIERMRRASQLNDRAMELVRGHIRSGMTEEDLADYIVLTFRRLGADGVSFEPLVGFGPNAAGGHHAPGGTVLREGDCVLVDMGCRLDGYCSDMTRTFFSRSVSDKMREVYETVRAANEAARAAVKPGVPLSQVDNTARDLITRAGYGDYFTHRLGHFIGLDVHEYGDVSEKSSLVAEPGMVFSIEPGIYLAGTGGIRIEDLVLVTEEGCDTLNGFSRQLNIVDS